MPTQPIKIDREFRDLIPPLTEDERAGLEASLKAEGCRDPLVTWNGILIDGHNRHEICERNGITYRTAERQFADRIDVRIWIRQNQVSRRNLTDDQRAINAVALMADLTEKAKSERSAKANSVRHENPSLAVKVASKENTKTERSRKKAAKTANITEHKMRRAANLKKKAPKKAEEVLKGKKTLKQAESELRSEERIERLKQAAVEVSASPGKVCEWSIILGDCVSELAKLPKESARLVFADPPYNIGFDYGDGAKADQLSDDEYMEWVTRWVRQCSRVLTGDGSLWLMINDEYAAEYAALIKEQGFTIRNWIIWHETFGVNCSGKFNRCHRHIFYAVKDPRKFCFNVDEPLIRRESDRQAKYNDARANADGKLLDDVWSIPRLTGTAAERIPEFPTQLPLELVRRIVAAASMPGDTVVDPFNGSGTTGAACIELGRKYIGIEKQEKFHQLATLRLKGVK